MSEIAEMRNLPYRQWFPWLELFRAGGLAVCWPQLGISFLAVAVFWTGAALIERLFVVDHHAQRAPELVRVGIKGTVPAAIDSMWMNRPWSDPLDILALPWRSMTIPIEQLVWGEPRMQFMEVIPPVSPWAMCFRCAWAVSVWSLFGAALCRSVAVLIAKDHSESLPHALRFAWPRWISAIGAPSIPAAGILVLVVGLIITAWFGRLPLIGTPLLTFLSPILLFAGMAIAFLTVLILLGWPLMVAAMGIEDCDGFGALSRAYSFLTGRPADAVWNVAVSAVLGGVLVAVFGGLVTIGLLALANFIYGHIGTLERWESIMNWSHFFAQWLLMTFAVSLFWTLATLNYLLLRQAVDGKPFDDIAPGPDESAGRRDLPVVGIPAAALTPEQRAGLLLPSDAETVAHVV